MRYQAALMGKEWRRSHVVVLHKYFALRSAGLNNGTRWCEVQDLDGLSEKDTSLIDHADQEGPSLASWIMYVCTILEVSSRILTVTSYYPNLQTSLADLSQSV